MTFGAHVDNAIRGIANSGIRIRTDVSSTLFISAPEDYDGGELVVEDTYGSHTVKLPAGDMIVYPATSLHHVTPITRGSRIASFFWTQSMIRDESKRSLLFDMDMAIIKLSRDHPEHSVGRRANLRLSQSASAVGRAVGSGKTRKKKTAPEDPGAASVYSNSLFRPLGGFLRKAQIDVVLDVDLLLHKSKVMRHIDVAL